jgi:hypothetical protein
MSANPCFERVGVVPQRRSLETQELTSWRKPDGLGMGDWGSKLVSVGGVLS